MFKRKSGFGGKSGGGRKFGGKDFGPRSFGSRSGGFTDKYATRPQLFRATCAECGDECQVPFKPNGSKPILCGNCFKKDDSRKPMRTERGAFGRPKFGESRMPASRPADTGRLEERLEELSMKLDRVLREIESLKESQS